MELFLLAIPLGLILGWLKKGSLNNIEKVQLKGLLIIPLAFFLRFLVNSPDLVAATRLSFLIKYFPFLNILAYLGLFLFAFLNSGLASMRLFASGTLLNAAAIFANGGKMPFEISEAEKAGIKQLLLSLAEAGSANLPSNRSALLWQLGDWIMVPGLRTYKLVSIGDIVLFAALVILIVELMTIKKEA